jgi:curved DNA-binding protein CbpA
MTIDEMKASTELPPARVELLVYLLVIAKCVEAVSGVRTHPSTGALPASMPSGPIPAVAPSSGETRHASREMPRPRYISSGEMSAVPPSSSRLPAAPGSSPRIPAVPGSNPRIAAQTGPRPVPTPIIMKTPLELGVDGVKARALTVERESYFEVLGLPEGGSSEAARAAYMRLSKLWHPDRLPPQLASVTAEATKIFTHMTKAQQTLCDPEARRAYLAERHPNSARPREQIMRDVRQALDRRDFETAIELCAALMGRDPEDAEALAIQTWAGLRGGEATEEELRAALPKMDKAVNMDRTNDEAFYHRGLVHKRLNNVPAAFRDFARALQLNPSHIGAEREVRLFAMRVKKGSGEHKLIAPLLEKLGKK